MFKAHKQLIIQLFKPFTKDFIIVSVLLIMIALLEAAIPYGTTVAIDQFITPKNTDGLLTFGIIYGTAIVLFATFVVLFIIRAGKLESSIAYSLRKEAFDRMQDYKFEYFDLDGVGKILSKITSDVGKLSQIISWGIVDLVWGFTFMSVVLVGMFIINWQLAIFVAITVPVLALISFYFQKKIFFTQKEVRALNSEVIRLINEGITGAITSKTLVTEYKNTEEFKDYTSRMKVKSIRSATLSSIYTPLALNVGSIGVAVIITAGGMFRESGIVTLGTLILFITYATMFFEPVIQVARVISEAQAAKAAAERVIKHLTEDHSLHVENPVPSFKIEGNIEFRDINISYDEREVVLDHFNLTVKAGEKIALVGETGSGKSTIVNLICKFYAPTTGKIFLDGVDYDDIDREFVQSNLGYVLQTPLLFSGTILENIRYGRLEATDAEVKQAATLAQSDDFITKLELGYETTVGEGGSRLSSGEKQLISIARAILADPRIFILDEATSSIDVNTEIRIQKAIE
nr:ABC transporter ATP-binding protein [Vallitaleaceae bacterium]